MLKDLKDWPWNKIVLAFFGFLFVLALAFSVVFESLLPLWRAGELQMLYRNLIGIPLIFIGVGMFIWSALRFLWDGLQAINHPEINQQKIKGEDGFGDGRAGASRKIPLRNLIKAWRVSFLLFVIAFSLMAAGGWLIN